jgi:transcription initiation factor IIE alpha subunit
MSKLDDIHFGGGVKAFFDLPIFGRARNSDPVTSHMAANQVTTPTKHFQIIHLALIEHGAMGKDQIAAKTGLDPNAVARRLPELQRLGLAATTGKLVESKAGRKEREWKAC